MTEAVRGEGGRLFNALGERFMERYDPARLELSSRDRVALANYTEIAEGRGGPHGGVFLDITHRGRAYIVDKLPRMYRQFIEWQMLDISREPMEVAPTAHYSMGGIVVDPETHATEVDGLYAAGECVGGLHGANRLGGNSLSETLISGRRAGEAATARALEARSVALAAAIDDALDELDALTRPGSELAAAAAAKLARPDVGAVRGRPDRGRSAGSAGGARGAARSRSDIDVRPTAEGWTDLAHALDLRAVSSRPRRRCGARSSAARHAAPTSARISPSRSGVAGELLPRRRHGAVARAGAGGPDRAREWLGCPLEVSPRAAARGGPRRAELCTWSIAPTAAIGGDRRGGEPADRQRVRAGTPA